MWDELNNQMALFRAAIINYFTVYLHFKRCHFMSKPVFYFNILKEDNRLYTMIEVHDVLRM